jgi:hypothetical protein
MAKDVELKAMKLVMNYEKRKGGNPKDVCKDKRYPCDIISRGRYIEVKGKSLLKPPQFLVLYKTTLKKLGNNVRKYWIYVVYDINRKPKLRMIPSSKILGNLEIDARFVLPGKVIRSKEIEEVSLTN